MTTRYRFLLFIISIFLLTEACWNESQEIVFNGKIHDISFGKATVFKGIQALPEGGFVITGDQFQGPNQQMWVAKFDQNLGLKWENHIGFQYNDYSQHTLITTDGEILVSGYTLLERGDSISKTYRLATYGIHLALFDVQGNLTWDEEIITFLSNSKPNQKIFSVFEDSEGKFLVNAHALYITLDPDSDFYGRYGLNPLVVRMDKNSTTPEYKVLATYSSNSRLNSIHESDGKYIFFGNQLRPKNSSASVFELYKHRFEGNDTLAQVSDIYSSGLIDKADDIVYQTSLDHEDHGGFSEYKVFAEGMVRFDYSYSDSKLTATELNPSFRGVRFAYLSDEKHFLFITEGQKVIETDTELNIVNSFTSPYPLTAICKLENNSYVGVYNKGKGLYLILFDEKGNLVDDE